MLAPFSFAFTGPSLRLSAPSAGVSKVSMNLFENFGRTDGVSKVSMPRTEGVQQPRCCRRQAHGRPLAAIAAAALSLCCRPRAHIPTTAAAQKPWDRTCPTRFARCRTARTTSRRAGPHAV